MSVLSWIEDHPGLAAWVQAFGTIAALLFAVLIPIAERRSAERATALAARSPLSSALSALTAATDYRRQSANDGPREEALNQRIHSAQQSFAGVPIHSLSARAAGPFQMARDAFFMCVLGFTDRRVGKFGFLILRREFLRKVQAAVQVEPNLLEHVEGLDRALTMSEAECLQLAESGVDPAAW
jgi:hypothetical protein